jgi:hypothetical protein
VKNRSKQIEALRDQIRARHGERTALAAQTRSRDEVRQKVAGIVAEWQRVARTQNSLHLRLLAHGQHPSLLDLTADKSLGPLLVLMLGAGDVEHALLASIDDVPEGLPTADREARASAIGAELDALEQEEEEVIVQAEDAGEFVVRRGDARPEIVLGKRDPVPTVRSPNYMGLGDVPTGTRPRTAVYSTYLGSSRP